MKRLLFLLTIMLFLCGCTNSPPVEPTEAPLQATSAPPAPTEPAGIYLPGSDLETETAGVVRSYTPGEDTYGLRTAGSDVLLFSGVDSTTLTRLSGDSLYVVAQHDLGFYVDSQDPAFQVSRHGITYFDPRSREVIFLDNDLKEVNRVGLSDAMVGKPILSSNRRQVFYCTADAVRVYDLETNLDRLLKTISYPEQSVSGIYQNDQVLHCTLRDAQSNVITLFLSTETGELLAQLDYGLQFTAGEDGYCALVPDGILDTIVFGTAGSDAQVLSPLELNPPVWFLDGTQAVVTASTSQDRETLNYYDLTSGLRTASISLSAGIHVQQMTADEQFLYILAQDVQENAPVLCRWDTALCPTGDETVYSGPWYTEDNPDTQGLAECAAWAQALGQTHGIQIRIGQEALAQEPWDYELTWEYSVPIIRSQLTKLEALLAHFPQGFFQKFSQEPIISLVRRIQGTPQSGSVASAAGIQFWEGEESHVVLAAGDTLDYAFFHELFHLMDSRILSTTRVFYHWENENPDGVRYFEDYTSYLTADIQQYLEGENRVFIDAYSLCYPREDRARIMEYACNPGNEHYFQSEIMQSKLRLLCKGIRQAFDLEAYQAPLLWEQYLQDSLISKE